MHERSIRESSIGKPFVVDLFKGRRHSVKKCAVASNVRALRNEVHEVGAI